MKVGSVVRLINLPQGSSLPLYKITTDSVGLVEALGGEGTENWVAVRWMASNFLIRHWTPRLEEITQ